MRTTSRAPAALAHVTFLLLATGAANPFQSSSERALRDGDAARAWVDAKVAIHLAGTDRPRKYDAQLAVVEAELPAWLLARSAEAEAAGDPERAWWHALDARDHARRSRPPWWLVEAPDAEWRERMAAVKDVELRATARLVELAPAAFARIEDLRARETLQAIYRGHAMTSAWGAEASVPYATRWQTWKAEYEPAVAATVAPVPRVVIAPGACEAVAKRLASTVPSDPASAVVLEVRFTSCREEVGEGLRATERQETTTGTVERVYLPSAGDGGRTIVHGSSTITELAQVQQTGTVTDYQNSVGAFVEAKGSVVLRAGGREVVRTLGYVGGGDHVDLAVNAKATPAQRDRVLANAWQAAIGYMQSSMGALVPSMARELELGRLRDESGPAAVDGYLRLLKTSGSREAGEKLVALLDAPPWAVAAYRRGETGSYLRPYPLVADTRPTRDPRDQPPPPWEPPDATVAALVERCTRERDVNACRDGHTALVEAKRPAQARDLQRAACLAGVGPSWCVEDRPENGYWTDNTGKRPWQ